jgi:hypothetical protein
MERYMPQKTPASELATFPTLPNEAHVDVHVVARLYGCSTASVWRRARIGVIVKPKKFGASSRWNVGELRQALGGASK